jgi:3-hydroxybutyryl-CoA dehydrogenase
MNIQRITVIGAGTMGHGIAAQAARCGFTVVLNDVTPERIEAGLAGVRHVYGQGLAKGKLTEEQVATAEKALRGEADVERAVAEADLVIEAIPEDLALKRQLFARLDAATSGHTLLASNTSSLSITEIAAATKHPDRVVGLHFFNPVAVMQLLEIVRGESTSEHTLAAAQHLAERLEKTAIVVSDSPGFATSRLGIALGNEAARMLEEGVASAADIDRAMTLGYRHPIGPLALGDLVGLDVRLAITEHLYREIGTDTFRPPRILKRLVRAGKLGRKTGEGFYKYE